jgi:uncharacterized protein YndB with AHSA1/START domain
MDENTAPHQTRRPAILAALAASYILSAAALVVVGYAWGHQDGESAVLELEAPDRLELTWETDWQTALTECAHDHPSDYAVVQLERQDDGRTVDYAVECFASGRE